jgi:hypothetical protein
VLVEVKARRGAAKPNIGISSEDQLSDVPGSRLFLCVSPVDAVIIPNGLTLNDHVVAMEKIFSEADTESFLLWDAAIEASGFDREDDYSERRWTLGQTLDHEVHGDFPRIVTPLPPGVSSVRYAVSLDACSEYRMQEGELDELISQRGRQ